MSHKLTVHAIALSFLATLAAVAIQAQQPQTVAHVLDVQGDWRIDGTTTTIAAGQALSAGNRIVATAPKAGNAITILRDDDMSRQRVACDGTATDPCRTPIVISDPSASQPSAMTQLKGIMQAAVSVLLNKPPAISTHYAMTLSRGADTIRELEAVAALDPSQGVAPPPPPQDMPAGVYTFSIAHADNPSSSTDMSVTLTSDGNWRPVSITAPGLYEVSILNADQEKVADLMLLVAAPADYEQERDKFTSLKNVAEGWTGPDARNDEHLLLRAFLLSESHS
jgi:hypothetical protein